MQFFETGDGKKEEIACSQCNKKPAEIFQVTGDYCVECWQMLTHTNA